MSMSFHLLIYLSVHLVEKGSIWLLLVNTYVGKVEFFSKSKVIYMSVVSLNSSSKTHFEFNEKAFATILNSKSSYMDFFKYIKRMCFVFVLCVAQ